MVCWLVGFLFLGFLLLFVAAAILLLTAEDVGIGAATDYVKLAGAGGLVAGLAAYPT